MQIKPTPSPARLSLPRRWLVYGVGAGVWSSGIIWLILHDFMARKSDFGPTPNPMEPWELAVHAGFGFAAVWLIGLLWGVHITRGWRMGRHRISGVTFLTFLSWLILSGYLLYYVGSDALRSLVSLSHWIVGIMLPIPFLTHWLVRYR